MNIFVDESGSFAIPDLPAPPDSWSVVVGYASPESDHDRLTLLMDRLKADCGGGDEIKINGISEPRYVRWLRDLSRLSGVAFAVALDVSLHDSGVVDAHRQGQADAIVKHRDKMIHASGRQGITRLAEDIRSLPLQLYTQLQCQITLFHQILMLAPTYYAQFKPETLSRFAWRIDRKDLTITRYEDAFRRILATAMQTALLEEPMIMLEGADYQHMDRFKYSKEEMPTYLKDTYGIETSGDGLNGSKMMSDDFEYVDSAAHPGVQAADLLASGLRRLIRHRFSRAQEIALGLGCNMVTQLRGSPQVRLMSLGRQARVPGETAHLLRLLSRKVKPILHA